MAEGGALRLGQLVEDGLAGSLRALATGDLALADRIVREDLAVNRLRFELEEEITRRLSESVGDAVRPLVASLYVLAELERMGDHAEGIAKVALMLGRHPSLPVPSAVFDLGSRTSSMLRRTLVALENEDAGAARQLCAEDDDIDALYDRVYQELIATMVADPERITEATYMLWIAHNLERIADRATNICERVVYLATGHVEELNVSKY